jgi:hypothetical protein
MKAPVRRKEVNNEIEEVNEDKNPTPNDKPTVIKLNVRDIANHK